MMRYTALLFTLAAAMPLAMTQDRAAAPRTAAQAEDFRTQAPASWLPADPADSLYRAARAALQRNEFVRSAQLFRQVRERYPSSGYVPDSFYWEAFSLYRAGSTDQLRMALELLQQQAQRHPRAETRNDATALEARIRGELGRRGDRESAAWVQERAARAAEEVQAHERDRERERASQECSDDEDDIRLAALNGLLQMDADRAIPILKRVLARRDAGSECLRRKAIFLVSQKRSAETEDILLAAVRGDPDEEVRRQGVFWLSQVATDKSVAALDSILRTSNDEEIQKAALFALSQQRNPRSAQILRDYALRDNAPGELQEQAIFWIGQTRSPENTAFLQNLYARTTNAEIKEKVLFSLAQQGGAENLRWIMGIALNEQEDIENRKQALFWAGQSRSTPVADIVALYGRVSSVEMKEHIIFVLSQRKDRESIDKLIDIARNDPNPELRKGAMFWVSQSNDPRAAELLEQILQQ